jgi:hypothetical protein
MRRRISTLLFALGAWGWLLAARVLPAVIVVDRQGGADFRAIQDALDAAEDGDIVLVKPGIHLLQQPLDFNRLRNPGPGGLPVKNLILRSEAGAADTVLRILQLERPAEEASAVVFRNGEGRESVVEGFTIEGASRACGIYCRASSPSIVDCRITLNASGICALDGSPAIKACVINRNGNGLSLAGVDAAVSGCHIFENLGGGCDSTGARGQSSARAS